MLCLFRSDLAVLVLVQFGDPVGVARGPFVAFEDRIAVDVEPVEPLVEIHPEIGAPEHGRRAEPRRHGGFGVAIGFIVVRAAEQREGQGGEKENSPHDAMNARRSEEHTSELQSLMRISYAVFCLKKKKREQKITICNRYTCKN